MEFETKHFFNNTEVDIDKVVDYIMQHPQDTSIIKSLKIRKNMKKWCTTTGSKNFTQNTWKTNNNGGEV